MDDKPAINPTGIYTSADLKQLLGLRCLTILQDYGLRAIGDRYLGQMIIECFNQAWKAKLSDDQQPTKVQCQTKPLSKIRPVIKIKASGDVLSLAEQLEQSRRMLQTDKARSKKIITSK